MWITPGCSLSPTVRISEAPVSMHAMLLRAERSRHKAIQICLPGFLINAESPSARFMSVLGGEAIPFMGPTSSRPLQPCSCRYGKGNGKGGPRASVPGHWYRPWLGPPDRRAGEPAKTRLRPRLAVAARSITSTGMSRLRVKPPALSRQPPVSGNAAGPQCTRWCPAHRGCSGSSVPSGLLRSGQIRRTE